MTHIAQSLSFALFHLPSWFHVLLENVAFRAMGTETPLCGSCCLRLPSENTFRSTPKEPPSEVYSRSQAQFLWDMVFNCSPPLKVAERGREVCEERKILLFPFGSSNLLCQGNRLWDGNLNLSPWDSHIWEKHICSYSSSAFWSPTTIQVSFNFLWSTTTITMNNSVKCNT